MGITHNKRSPNDKNSRRVLIKKRSKEELQRIPSKDNLNRSVGVVFGVRDAQQKFRNNEELQNVSNLKNQTFTDVVIRASSDLQLAQLIKKHRDNSKHNKFRRVLSNPQIITNQEQDDVSLSPIQSAKNNEPNNNGPPHICPEVCPDDMDPDSYIKLLAHSQMGFLPQPHPSLSLPTDIFPPPTEAHIASYTIPVIEAVRDRDTTTLRSLLAAGHSLNGCNRFGESLIHTACRRGFADVALLLVEEGCASLRVRDDYGRTPAHDACWNRVPAFEVLDLVVRRDSFQFFLRDKRGFTPFQYARREHWGLWRRFLYDRREFFTWDERIQGILGNNHFVGNNGQFCKEQDQDSGTKIEGKHNGSSTTTTMTLMAG